MKEQERENSIFSLCTEEISRFCRETAGEPVRLKLSSYAMLACWKQSQERAEECAKTLSVRAETCRLFSVPLLREIRERNGWILFDLDPAAFNEYAHRLPEQFEIGTEYADRRMEIFRRHPDVPLPEDDTVLRTVLRASRDCLEGKWTPQTDHAVLTMTHHLTGMERVNCEQRLHRAAKIILYERGRLL